MNVAVDKWIRVLMFVVLSVCSYLVFCYYDVIVLSNPSFFEGDGDVCAIRFYEGGERQSESSLTGHVYGLLKAGSTDAFSIFSGYVYVGGAVNVEGKGRWEEGVLVDSDFFDAISVPPEKGRYFDSSDYGVDSPHSIIVTYDYWRERVFSGDESLGLGSVELHGKLYEVVGVLPRGVEFPVGISYMLPLSNANYDLEGDRWANIFVLGCLRPGSSKRLGVEVLKSTWQNYAGKESGGTIDIDIIPIRNRFNGGITQQAGLFLCVVVILAFSVSFNVLIIYIIKFIRQRPVLSVKRALGASEARLFFETLREMGQTALLALLLGGVWVILFGTIVLEGLKPDLGVPVWWKFTLSLKGGGVMLCSVIVALFPTFSLLVLSLVRRRIGNEASVFSNAKVGRVAERIVLRTVLVLLFAIAHFLTYQAVLSYSNYSKLRDTDLGIETKDVVWVGLNVSSATADRQEVYEEILTRVQSLPEVKRAGVGVNLPGGFYQDVRSVKLQFGGNKVIDDVVVSYFTGPVLDILGIGALRPGLNTAPSVDSVFVDQYQKALGVTDGMGFSFVENEKWYEIQQVVEPTRTNPYETQMPRVYLPLRDYKGGGVVHLFVESNYEGPDLLAKVQSAASEVGGVSLWDAFDGDYEDFVAQTYWQDAFEAKVLVFLAISCAIVCSIGVFVVVYEEIQRSYADIAIRLSLGAKVSVMQLGILFRCVGLAVAGCCFSLFFRFITQAFFAEAFLGRSDDFRSVGVSCSIIVLVGLACAWVGSRCLSRIDPASALANRGDV